MKTFIVRVWTNKTKYMNYYDGCNGAGKPEFEVEIEANTREEAIEEVKGAFPKKWVDTTVVIEK